MAEIRKKVLAIDDESEILDALRETLEGEGYEVCTAKNGIEGLEMAKEFRPDLIFLDVMMPKMNGFQFLDRVGVCPEIRKTPVVMLSAHGDSDNIFKSESYRVCDFLIKPFRLPDLMDALHRYA